MTYPNLHWHIDRVEATDSVMVSGWCFVQGKLLDSITLQSGAQRTQVPLDVPRHDVLTSHGECTIPLDCGFTAKINLPPGTHDIGIFANISSGQSICLEKRSVNVAEPTLKLNIETPDNFNLGPGMVRVSGWCIHPLKPIEKLEVMIGHTRVACIYGMVRDDVQTELGNVPGAGICGFHADVMLEPGVWPIRLYAILADGGRSEIQWNSPLRVQRPAPARKAGSSVSQFYGFTGFVLRQGRSWVRENRRLPAVREWAAMARFARARFLESSRDDTQHKRLSGFSLPKPVNAYQVWREVNQPSINSQEQLTQRMGALTLTPTLSLIMPVYNPSLVHLEAAIMSVRNQSYPHWELCIADDASSSTDIRSYLRETASKDQRIKVVLRKVNGNISACTNSAAALAEGEFLVLLDQDDLLDPNALAHLALCMADAPDADIIYSDDDKIDDDGHHYAPQFKPDWSPSLLLGFMYFSHIFCVRRTLFKRLGGLREGYEGAQDYDFALRAAEKARSIVHIPQVLYHWRATHGSTALSADAKPNSFRAGLSAVQDALVRRGINAIAYQPDWAKKGKLGIFACRFPDDGPMVSIIIPTYNGLSILKRCVESLKKTSYRNFEVLIVDNESDDPEILAYLAALPHRNERIKNPEGRFNFAHINNRAAKLALGDLLLFLNNDTEVVSPGWLSQMVGHASRKGVGAVGARLLFPDQRVQHAGIVHGYYNGLAGPAFKLTPDWDGGYLSLARVTRDCAAVTAACMLTPRELFLSIGGFDEREFEVAYNDVDYCYRLADRGLRSVYCAEATLLHHEGHSRGFCDRPQEIARFRSKYHDRRDPYYNPHLSLEDESFRVKPRRLAYKRVQPVRALMCAFNLNLEGAPHSQLELTLGLKKGGFIEPVVYSPSDGPLREAYEDAGIDVHIADHPLRGVFDEPAYDKALEAFAQFIRDQSVEVVYGNTLQTFYAIDAAHRVGVPSLWNPRESEPWHSYFNFLPGTLAHSALNCFSYPYRVIFVANATREVWTPLESRANFTVIHNGLNLTKIQHSQSSISRKQARDSLSVADSDIVFMLPGTVCERKGQIDLVQALASMSSETQHHAQYFIVGDRENEYSQQLHQLRAAMPTCIRDRVHIVPETADIHRYYRAADVAVCTSRVESFPRVILEAMAFDLPIVTTGVFGITEQVMGNINALLYTPGDIPRLTKHLTTLLSDQATRQTLASNAAHVLATLNSYDQMVAAYGELFLEAAVSATALGRMEKSA